MVQLRPLNSHQKHRSRKVWLLVLMAAPGLLWYLIFRYGPMVGLVSAFQDYSPFLGFFDSPWVGLDNFQTLFSRNDFLILFRNTATLGFLGLVVYFPLTIVLALLIDSLVRSKFQRFVQTVLFAPYFVSWVVVAQLTIILFSSPHGLFSQLFADSTGSPFLLLTKPEWFQPTIILQQIWKEAGWGTVILLAAMTGIDRQQHEAAEIDGATALQRVFHVTIPGILPTLVALTVLRLGNFLDLGFEQIFTILNPLVQSTGDVFETFAYRVGIGQGKFGYATAIGMFKSVVAVFLVVGANRLAKKYASEGVF